MTISLILAHPNPGSFNHAIATTARQTLGQLGHAVSFHDLYAEAFPPLLTSGELRREAKLGALLRQHCEEIASADGIVIVHPNWWGMPPAILTGWVDRVLRADVAYRFVEGDQGEGVPQGLLKARAAVVFNTSDTAEEREHRVFGDPLELIWRNCIFDLCGVRQIVRRTFRVVVTSTPEHRRQWLQEAADDLARHFPADHNPPHR